MSLSNKKLLATAISTFTLFHALAAVAAGERQGAPLLLPEFADSAHDEAAESRGHVAVGELQRIRRDDGTRRLALLDESGSITAFLAPTARINLRQYLGQKVSVTALSVTRGDDKAPYVIPERVTPLGPRTSPPSVKTLAGIDRSSRNSVQPAVGGNQPIGTAVRRTSGELPLGDGSPVVDAWEVIGDEGPGPEPFEYVEGDPGVAPCGSCGFECGGGCGNACCGPWGRLFVRAEYLALWSKGMNIPALVTTSTPGTGPENAGVLGLNSTDILYGNGDILDDGHSGFRIRFGSYWDPCRRFGWEAEYFGFGDESEHFEAFSNGNGEPILARPFFNMNPRVGGGGDLDPPAREDAELVAYPGILSGEVTVDSQTTLDSAGGRFRWNFCCKQLECGGGCFGHCGPSHGFSRVDFLAGYRYLGLQDQLIIREDLTSLQANNPGRFEIFDHFQTENEFNGAEFGFVWEGGWRRWTLEFISKMALGNVRQQVAIDGGTTISPLTQPQQTFDGGLLAQRSNMGIYSNDEFGMLNELGLTLGLFLNPRLRFTVGYTLVYLTPVVRAGDQIDLDVNPDLLPPETDPFVGPLRPRFAFEETDYWADGVNVGLDMRW